MSRPSRHVAYRPRALADIERQVRYLADEVGIELAHRFVDAVFDSAADLGEFPKRGALVPHAWAQRTRLRSIRVAGFSAVRIYYRELDGGVVVSRVLDSRRDLSSGIQPR